MAFRLIPKDESFFDMFEQAANRLVTAAGVLVEATARVDTLPENAKRLERLEHDADQLTHELVEKVNRTFITPFDREDIYSLATELDDVMDLMEAATERFILFKVQQMMPQAQEIAKVIAQQAQQIPPRSTRRNGQQKLCVVQSVFQLGEAEDAHGDRWRCDGGHGTTGSLACTQNWTRASNSSGNKSSGRTPMRQQS